MFNRTCIPTIIATAFAIFWLAGFIGFSVHIKGIVQPKAPHTDAIIVLTGGPDRINEGLNLLDAKHAKHLFISGVNTKVSVDQLVSMWRQDVIKAPCCVVLGHEAQNTFENAAEARDWIDLNDIDSVLLLTANYHMPRAWLEFKAIMPDINMYAYPIRSQKKNWLLVVHEYNKTLVTMLRLALT